jgi:hypothetical protein
MCLQVGCSVVAARGLVTVWERIMAERRPAKRSPAIPMFTLAIVIHGAYNAAVLALNYAGFLF